MHPNHNEISRYLSYILRHKPESIDLVLDTNGWACIDELIAKTHKLKLDVATLAEVTKHCPKQRFSLDLDNRRIKANQGHSVNIDLALTPQSPPACLYHGTARRNLASIEITGLQKRQRHHVHMSVDIETAKTVGARYGDPVILQIDTQAMYQAGHVFYCSANGVWLTGAVPPHYLKSH